MGSLSIRYFLVLFSALQWHFAIEFLSCSSLLATAQSTDSSIKAGEEGDLADFGQMIPILGQMERTDQDFKDGLALDLFSPRNRTLVVQKNTTPLPGNFVTGSTGEPFIALSNYSYVIKVNDSAWDLIAKVELPYEPEKVRSKGVNVDNTYVGVLSGDGKSWVVDESKRNVHISENKTRIIKLTSLDGEYILLGRQTVDTANIFVQYGFGATRTVNLTGGKGIQEAEFVDGLSLSAESEKELKVNGNLKSTISPKALPAGTQSLNTFAWAINSSAPNQQLKNASIHFPVNLALLRNSTSAKSVGLIVARRDMNASASAAFEPINRRQQEFACSPDCRIKVSNMKQLDGEYVILKSQIKKKKGEEAVEEGVVEAAVQEPTLSPPASSAATTLRRAAGRAGPFMSMCLYAALLSSVF